jgi:hypothetical protein
MNRVRRDELLPLGEYELIRERFRNRIIQDKKARRFSPSSELSVIFENHETVLFQIQEMLRTERITKEESIQHEIDTYNELVPLPQELSATLFVEIAEKDIRDARLVALAGMDHTFALEIAGKKIPARNETRGLLGDRTTAVHYLKFPLGPEGAAAFLVAAKGEAPDGDRGVADVAFLVEHPALTLRAPLPLSLIRALVEDLAA